MLSRYQPTKAEIYPKKSKCEQFLAGNILLCCKNKNQASFFIVVLEQEGIPDIFRGRFLWQTKVYSWFLRDGVYHTTRDLWMKHNLDRTLFSITPASLEVPNQLGSSSNIATFTLIVQLSEKHPGDQINWDTPFLIFSCSWNDLGSHNPQRLCHWPDFHKILAQSIVFNNKQTRNCAKFCKNYKTKLLVRCVLPWNKCCFFIQFVSVCWFE